MGTPLIELLAAIPSILTPFYTALFDRARGARRPFTQSCSKYHLPSRAEGISAAHSFLPWTVISFQPAMGRPPLNTGLAPGQAASKRPESSGVNTTGTATSTVTSTSTATSTATYTVTSTVTNTNIITPAVAASRSYAGKNLHGVSQDSCVSCHSPHTLEVTVNATTCGRCHFTETGSPVASMAELEEKTSALEAANQEPSSPDSPPEAD